MTTTPNLSKADQKRLTQLHAERRSVRRAVRTHPVFWYGVPEGLNARRLFKDMVADERARIDAEIERLTAPPVPVLEGVIVRPAQGALW